MWTFVSLVLLVLAGGFFRAWLRQRSEFAAQLALKEKQADALREEHARADARALAQQQALFNSMTEGVLLLDADGRVQLVNEAFSQLFAVTGDVRGRTIMEALRLHQVQELVNRTLIEGKMQDGELALPGVEGDRHFAVNGAAVVDIDGQRQGMILVFHDLTRLKQLENTRREFVANVSHELRTPLSLIKGYVETLIDGAKDNPEVALKFLHTIERHADRLTFLIEDLLTISRLESGQMVINLGTIELRPAVARVLDDLSTRAAARQATLANEVPEMLHASADPERLHQVLANLVDNAIIHGRVGGTVRIGAQPLTEHAVEIWVQDDGAGIPPEACARVFERFYRADKARSREGGGTGLGLAIVKHLVLAHGGEVRVEGGLGRGAKFAFTLRRAACSG
ncbi:MAG: PAS domain-containing protein [Verrucomicrobia bacterium]|nr:PAS domain-containing protein [Verrucomicrobiota bacterium]